MNETQIRGMIKREMLKYESLRKAATAWKISPSYLSDIMKGKRGVSEAMANLVGYHRLEPKEAKFVKLESAK
jgi:plasmid maintenance system antidote protein VapI